MALLGTMGTFLLCCSLFETIITAAVTVPSNIEAQLKVLYTNSSAKIVSQVFSFTFSNTAFTTIPNFGYGINDFNLDNSLAHVYFMSQPTNLTQKSVGISVTVDNNTNILKVSINYISIWNYGGIFIISKSYANVKISL